MLERIVTAVILALLRWLENRYEASRKPVEADRNPDALARIGYRVRMWEDHAHQRRQPDAGGTPHDGIRLPPDA